MCPSIEKVEKRSFGSNTVNGLPSDTLINGIIRKWAGDAGIANKTVTFHTGRQTFGTIMLTLGADLYTVSKL